MTVRVSEGEFARLTGVKPRRPKRDHDAARQTGSEPEERFALQCRVEGLTPEREYVFAKPRRFRLDFAWPAERVCVEIQGGIWNQGRHLRGAGYLADAEKANLAVQLGWKLLRVSPAQVADGTAIKLVKEVLA